MVQAQRSFCSHISGRISGDKCRSDRDPTHPGTRHYIQLLLKTIIYYLVFVPYVSILTH